MHGVRVVACICCALFAGPIAGAPQQPNLIGTWRYEVVQPDGDARCGKQTTVGELSVTKKITARAYRGNRRTVNETERCGVTGHAASDFTLRIRDNAVSIEYDEENGWSDDSLLLAGDTMTSTDKEAGTITYRRVVDSQFGTMDIDEVRLNEFLESLRPDFTAALRKEYGARMLQNLRKTGLSRNEAMEVAMTTVDRMTDCVLNLFRNEIITMGLPLDEFINGRKTHAMLHPENVDYRKIECVYDTATNAGVIIH